MYAYPGTTSLPEVLELLKKGDKKAELILNAMAFQVAKEIGALSTVFMAKVDAIILTGGCSKSVLFTELIKERVCFFGNVMVMESIGEMTALAKGVLARITG
jgi:butyrate kinase